VPYSYFGFYLDQEWYILTGVCLSVNNSLLIDRSS